MYTIDSSSDEDEKPKPTTGLCCGNFGETHGLDASFNTSRYGGRKNTKGFL